MIWHSVGGSSSRTGAKLSERTCFGSTEGRDGGSINVLMTSSMVVKRAVARDVCGCGRGFAGDETAVWLVRV